MERDDAPVEGPCTPTVRGGEAPSPQSSDGVQLGIGALGGVGEVGALRVMGWVGWHMGLGWGG